MDFDEIDCPKCDGEGGWENDTTGVDYEHTTVSVRCDRCCGDQTVYYDDLDMEEKEEFLQSELSYAKYKTKALEKKLGKETSAQENIGRMKKEMDRSAGVMEALLACLKMAEAEVKAGRKVIERMVQDPTCGPVVVPMLAEMTAEVEASLGQEEKTAIEKVVEKNRESTA